MRLMRFTTIGLALIASLAISACEVEPKQPTADQKQAEATAQMAAEANMQVGMPGITNFTEKKLAKTIYELRDQEGFITYTYIVDWDGNLVQVCNSVGYGLPYAVQFSNPERVAHRDTSYAGSFGTLPQPEPNGLFMPDSLSATWVLCSDGSDPRPLYVEPEIIVSPFPLTAR